MFRHNNPVRALREVLKAWTRFERLRVIVLVVAVVVLASAISMLATSVMVLLADLIY